MIGAVILVARWCAALRCGVKRVMDVLLHIGAHRTGTTTFQCFLQRNQTPLWEAGVAVWTPERTRNGLMAGLVRRPQDITEQVERTGTRSCGVMRVEIARTRALGMHQLIVSEENMIGAMRNNLREGLLYPLLNERLMRFRAAFADSCSRIAIGIRSYDTLWASQLAFALTQGQAAPDRADLDRLVTQPRTWRKIIREVAGVFPKAEIVVWPFERLVGQPDRQLQILTGGVRVTNPMTGQNDWQNPSPQPAALREILAMRGDKDGAAQMPSATGRWMPFDDDQKEILRAQYQIDLAWLRQGAEGLARFVDSHGDDREIPKQPCESEVAGMNPPRPPHSGGYGYGKQQIVV
ncbi:MAG: hypothetical protein COB65_11505 [Thalassobium sp.]|nr:MAG: hypothetical protein COB65_11505 [Thalassobium sp.]